MSATPSKAMVLSIDSAVACRVYGWARSGLLPAFGRLMERGVHAANCLACYPTATPPNRATVATGAWPGTHGVVDGAAPSGCADAAPPLPGLDDLAAETLWNACKRGGRKSVVLRWPSPWFSIRLPEAEPVVAGGEGSPEALLDTVDRYLTQVVGDTKSALAQPWEVCFLTLDLLDGFHQHQLGQAERTPKGKGSSKSKDVELKVYQRLDRALDEILELVGDETLVVVVSAHGVKPQGKPVEIGPILEQAGLLAYLPVANGSGREVDWSRTRAVPWGTVHISVNLKGRNPNGIVEPGDEYEAVVQRVIDALHDYTDPETGLKPVNLALRAEDARILGLYGDRIGDVVYALDPRFGTEYGAQLPASRFDGGDLRGLFVMAGPGVKKGEVLNRNVWLTDVVPTVCYLAELPIPRECEGCVIYQALEDPDAKVAELEALRAELARLKQAVERPGMMC